MKRTLAFVVATVRRARVVVPLAAAVVALPALAAKVTVEVRDLPKPAAAPVDPALAKSVAGLYGMRCGLCHGPNGEGDGVTAASLNPKPRRFSDALWQASVTDDQIRQVIVGGGASRKLSTLMIASPDLKDKPELDALVAFIRSKRAPDGTARLTVGAAPNAKALTADAKDGVARFEIADVKPGTHVIAVQSVAGEHCRTAAVVQATDVSVVCAPAAPAAAMPEKAPEKTPEKSAAP